MYMNSSSKLLYVWNEVVGCHWGWQKELKVNLRKNPAQFSKTNSSNNRGRNSQYSNIMRYDTVSEIFCKAGVTIVVVHSEVSVSECYKEVI